MKHKHAELIKAWADGAEIEIFSKLFKEWRFISEPDWNKDYQFRIKPEPKTDVVEYLRVGRRTYSSTLEWSNSTRANLKLIYDGETGVLKNAEVIK